MSLVDDDGGGGKPPIQPSACTICCNSSKLKAGPFRRAAYKFPLLLNPLRREKRCSLRATDPGVRVLPIPPIEQQNPIDRCISQVFFFVPYGLHEDRLRSGLDDLIRNHWPLLGARLARRRDGRLEYRLPDRFPEEDEDGSYRLFGWSTARHGHAVASIPGVLQQPTKPEGGARLQAEAGQWDALLDALAGPDWPRERLDAASDTPLVTVRVSSFTDGTVVGVCIPHTVADQMGVGCIVRAWLGLVDGRKPPSALQTRPLQLLEGYQPPPPSSDCSTTPPASVAASCATMSSELKERPKGTACQEDQLAARPRIMTRMEKIRFALAVLPEVLMTPKEIHGTLFLPLKLVGSLQSRICSELEVLHGNEAVGELGISEGDVISAILCKLSNLHRRPDSRRSVSLAVVVNLRGRIPELPRGGTSYVHSAIIYGFARLGKVHRATSLAEMAYRHRLAVLKTTEPDEIEANLEVVREEFAQRGNPPPMFAEPGDRPYLVSNWSAAWKDVDFSSAAVRSGNGAEDDKSTATTACGDQSTKRPLLVMGRAHTRETPMRFISMVMCKTEEGYWATFTATKRNMRKVEDYLARDPLLESFV